jgi:regulator of sigma E protease
LLGIRMRMGEVTVVCDNSPALAGKVQARDPSRKRFGDTIQKVEVREPDGSITTFLAPDPVRETALALASLFGPTAVPVPWVDAQTEANLDPLRLPDNLRRWAARMAGKPAADWTVTLYVRSYNDEPRSLDTVPRKLELRWDANRPYQDAVPMDVSSPWAIPELGLAYQVKTEIAAVDRFRTAEGAGDLQPGDVIEQVKTYSLPEEGYELKESSWIELKEDQWAHVFYMLQPPSSVVSVSLRIKRNQQEVKIKLRPDETWPSAERGLFLDRDTRLQKADDIFEAAGMGLKDTWNTMRQVYYNLRGMLIGRISPKNLGGPITIARAAYNWAGVDFWEFVFFLGLISINLAVINFLPIPVLDGGHMVFLIYEKIRGKPASEQVRVGATYAGLLMLASLMIFVIYLDISRIVRGG